MSSAIELLSEVNLDRFDINEKNKIINNKRLLQDLSKIDDYYIVPYGFYDNFKKLSPFIKKENREIIKDIQHSNVSFYANELCLGQNSRSLTLQNYRIMESSNLEFIDVDVSKSFKNKDIFNEINKPMTEYNIFQIYDKMTDNNDDSFFKKAKFIYYLKQNIDKKCYEIGGEDNESLFKIPTKNLKDNLENGVVHPSLENKMKIVKDDQRAIIDVLQNRLLSHNHCIFNVNKEKSIERYHLHEINNIENSESCIIVHKNIIKKVKDMLSKLDKNKLGIGCIKYIRECSIPLNTETTSVLFSEPVLNTPTYDELHMSGIFNSIKTNTSSLYISKIFFEAIRDNA